MCSKHHLAAEMLRSSHRSLTGQATSYEVVPSALVCSKYHSGSLQTFTYHRKPNVQPMYTLEFKLLLDTENRQFARYDRRPNYRPPSTVLTKYIMRIHRRDRLLQTAGKPHQHSNR